MRGLEDQWRPGLLPWALTEEGDRWYGRGTADNKGQHALNLAALEAVIAERGGRLGFNVKLVLEMAEERGSKGLREFVAAHAEELAADALIASDGPRVDPGDAHHRHRHARHLPLRPGGEAARRRRAFRPLGRADHRPGGAAGACDLDHDGPQRQDPGARLAAPQRRAGRGPRRPRRLPGGGGGGEGAATIDPDWGEPGLTAAEKIYGWNSLIILAMVSGRPENPVNAVAPDARAHCQIRYTVDSDTEGFEAALRQHLDAHGLEAVKIENAFVRMAASRTAPDHPWVRWAQASMERSLGKAVQIIPNSSGGLPGDVFVDHLGVPLVWVPHSYNGCKQHGPDEHLLIAPAREGLLAFTGMWWDLGEAGTPG